MSKKTVKIIASVLTALFILAILSTNVFAIGGIISAVEGATAKGQSSSGLTNLGGYIVGTIQVIGVIVAIVVLLVLGIKYMTGSAEERAEYKKTMIPYLVGAVLIFASTTIVNVVYNLANGLNGAAVSIVVNSTCLALTSR